MASRFRDWLFSIPFLVGFAVVMLSADLLQRIFKKNENISFKICNFVCNSTLNLLKVAGVRFKYEMPENLKEKLDNPKPKIFISNHQSLMDIAIFYHLFPEQRLRFIAKQELAKGLPYVSLALRTISHCLIVRQNRSLALESLRNFAKVIRQEGCGMVIFPEGTRAREGVMKKFKIGGFSALVDELGEAEIVPITFDGSWKIAKNKLMPIPYGTNVTVTVHDSLIVQKDDDLVSSLKMIEDKIGSKL